MIRRLFRRWIYYLYIIRVQTASNRLHLGTPLSLTDKAILFLSAMLQWRRDGYQLSPEGVVARRLAICGRHPECWLRRAGIRYCARCGCTAAKHRLPSSKCPRGFW